MRKLAFLTSFFAVILLTSRCTLFPWGPIGPTPEPNPNDTIVVVDTVVTDSTDVEFYSVSLGDTVVLDFASNATTGFQWHWDNSTMVSNVDSVGFYYFAHQTLIANNTICGNPGTEFWTFKGVHVGTEKLEFSYIRPWEGVQTNSTKRLIEITVTQ